MAWTRTQKNHSYDLSITTTAVAMASAAVPGDVIDQDISGKGCIMGIDISIAGTDVTATLILQASHDGTTWITAATVLADTNPNVTGVSTALVDLTAISAPYFRLNFNPTGLGAGTTGRFKFIVCSSQMYTARLI